MNLRHPALTSIIFLTSFIIILGSAGFLAFANSQSTFTASATVTNTAPTVSVQGGLTLSGATATTANVYVYFNATDANGAADLDNSTATVRINKSGNTDRTSANCTATTISASTNSYNCTIVLYYYDQAGVWSINATINDSSSNQVSNTTVTATVSTLDAISLTAASISFTGSPGTSDVAASPNPVRINNTGNQDYTAINVTGFDFANGATILGVGNVTVNVSVSGGVGQSLTNNTNVNVTNAQLNRGAVSLQNLSFYLDIPASQAGGSYSAQSNWIIRAIQ